MCSESVDLTLVSHEPLWELTKVAFEVNAIVHIYPTGYLPIRVDFCNGGRAAPVIDFEYTVVRKSPPVSFFFRGSSSCAEPSSMYV
jgi:hypothetical protein